MYRLVLLCALAASACAPTRPPLPYQHPTAAEVEPGSAALSEIRPGVWVHVSTQRLSSGTLYPSNGLVVRDGDGLFLVDTAWGEEATVALLDVIATEIGLPVEGAVVTHFHDDRTAGADVLRAQGIPVYASPLTQRLAAEEGNAVPAVSLDEIASPGDAVGLGPVEVFFPGGGHTHDNLVVYVPHAGVLHGGCAVHELGRQSAGNTADADLDSWPAALRRVLARYPDAEVVVPGHGAPGGTALLTKSIEIVERAQRGG